MKIRYDRKADAVYILLSNEPYLTTDIQRLGVSLVIRPRSTHGPIFKV
jgi:uncharacterized protein YuzE